MDMKENGTTGKRIQVTVNDEEVLAPPDVASELAKRFVSGLLAMDGRMISIISLESVLPAQEHEEVQ